jgi:hypothetical protein
MIGGGPNLKVRATIDSIGLSSVISRSWAICFRSAVTVESVPRGAQRLAALLISQRSQTRGT